MSLARVPLAAIVALSLCAGPAAASDCTPEVVTPEQGPRRTDFLSWLKVHWKDAGWTEADYLLEGDEPAVDRATLRIADINNDGSDEYVLSTIEGSGHYLNVWVFRRSPTGWTYLKETPLDAALEMSHDFWDRHAHASRLLVRLCEKTYVSLASGAGSSYAPDSYVWEKGIVRPACDVEWLRAERSFFQRAFDEKLYDEAHGFLDGVQRNCAKSMDAETWRWMQSDLALTAYRLKTYEDCLDHVAEARKSAGFAAAGAGLKKALAANEALCAKARTKAAAAVTDYDFSWLQELKADPDKQFALDPRFHGLLAAVVPEVKVDNDTLRNLLKLSVWLPDPTQFVGDRYIVLTGCEPHNCSNRGLIWIDTVGKRSIGATGGRLASRTVDPAHIPAEFWESSPTPSGMAIEFYGADGSKQEIAAP